MAKIVLSKSALQKQREQLKLYQRLLPSLDLKRRQITAELAKSKDEYAKAKTDVDRVETQSAEQLPMLANRGINVSGLVILKSVQERIVNVVGVKLPILDSIEFEVSQYSFLAKPVWVDVFVERLKESIEYRARLHIASKRVTLLEQAMRRITQRVNLFEKILIPETKKTIKRIQIFLGDAERAAVVRSKIAKAKNQAEQKAKQQREIIT